MYAQICYHECMNKHAIQYTVRIDDPGLDRAVRALAKKQGKSINQTILDTLYKNTNYAKKSQWVKYEGAIPLQTETELALKAQRVVDSKDWQ